MSEVVPRRPRVVTAMPLTDAARQRLAQLLGARVIDVRDPERSADVVLSPSASPQLVGMLQRTYPGARIVVVELDDTEFGIDYAGPVRRLLHGGADAYLVADSLADLAAQLAAGPAAAPVAEQAAADELPSAPHALPEGADLDHFVTELVRQAIEHPR